MTYSDVLLIILVLVIASILMIGLIIAQKYILKHKLKKNQDIQRQLTNKYIFNKKTSIDCSINRFFLNFFELSQKFKFTQGALNEAYMYYYKNNYVQKLNRYLQSKNEYKRIKAITFLSLFKNDKTIKLLRDRLPLEQKEHIKLLIVNGLKHNIDKSVLRSIITSLINSRRPYQIRVIKILEKYIDQSEHNLSIYFNSPLIEIKESFVELASNLFHPSFEKPLIENLAEIENHYVFNDSIVLKNITRSRVDRLYQQTLTALSKYYNYDLSSIKYLSHVSDEVVKIAITSLINKADLTTVEYLLSYSSQTQRDLIFTEGIFQICENNKVMYKDLYALFTKDINKRKKQLIAGVLSKKMDYLIISVKEENEFSSLISFMIKSRYSINIINWLNKNKNQELQDKILDIIKTIATEDYQFYIELNNYLSRDLFKKMGFIYTYYPGKDKPSTDPESRKTKWLTIFLIVCVLILPLLFIVSNFGFILNSNFEDIITKYIVSLNKGFVGYYLIVNLLYLFFAFISLLEYNQQERMWKIKNEDFLYEDGVISPISIIVPAYNEEVSIVDSLKSLLSLRYPVYEVIVVNDGSKDNTLQSVIDAFDLKRVDYNIEQTISTMPIRAVYKNKFHIKLSLIDKENGGKADSLNVGINYSKHDYVCGIDADSLIESNGLLRMMSTVLDHDSITLALGGSIVPVNGAIVSHGVVEEYNLPKSIIAKFQTIEYIRAFNAGRLGFSRMKCFLIVSGAFGLFEKRMLSEIGGYLTASSMRKDTVGEDMELVVRIARRASESNMSYRIQYVPMARCYTEVPEERKSLLGQRNRWQKGLIDTLSLHRKMIFNRKYKANGTIAMPYFFIFEMLGPVLEIQVYLSILIGLLFGIFDGVLLLLLFTVTMFLGMFVTLVSIYLQEKYTEPFSIKDTIKLVLFSIIENFGWRQFISIYRSFGFFTSFKSKQSWGKMKRIGYKKTE
ncbi:MAG: glycosyltransferase family 2 protein [Clostridiales bacterium]|nr:glycosyltransferase family 2 protein [Clostridiales bacterium]